MLAMEQRGFKNLPLKSLPVTAFSTAVADANQLLQAAIQQIPGPVKAGMVLRCEELPTVVALEEELSNAFCQLLQLITDHRPLNTQLYLFISCAMPPTEDINLLLPMGFRPAFIQFQTNLPTSVIEATYYQQAVNKIAALVRPFGGDLTITQLKNSGSVFTFSLAGKQ